MSVLKVNGGDSIAQEFLRLLGNSPGFQKEASKADAITDVATSHSEALSAKKEGEQRADANKEAAKSYDPADTAKEVAEMFVSKTNDAHDPNVNMLDDQLKTFASKRGGSPGKNERVLYGLSKIASSLRAKGEGFAADVVVATAVSIREDIKKEASKNAVVFNALKKMATDFDRKGDRFAADMVRTTALNIRKKAGMFDMASDAAKDVGKMMSDAAGGAAGIAMHAFPEASKEAVRMVQKMLGVTPDGIFGQETASAFLKATGLSELPSTIEGIYMKLIMMGKQASLDQRRLARQRLISK